MSNYKIRVNSEAESKEVQELFSEFGLNMNDWSEFALPKYISNFIDGEFSDYSIYDSGINDWKEITLPDLRDLVVLKRNDVGDATHESHCGELKFILLGDWWNLFTGGKWQQFSHKQSPRCNKLKPIEKPMKEYLRKNNDGEYILEVTKEREAQEPHAKHWIEVPKGCDYLISVFGVNSFIDSDMFAKVKPKNVLWSRKPMKEYLDPENGYKLNLTDRPFFDWIEIPEGANFAWKSDGKYVFFTALERGYRDASVVWSRHTIPEELPFIDDEPKLDTQMACMEREFERDQCMENARREGLLGDPRIGAPLNTYDEPSVDTYKSEFGIEPPISLNDQYAEIEKVRQTLKTRQDQYGSFEDVAMITEQMVDIMRKGYYENLAYNQKMALYMICSKMARIVNGNPNHKDSWHDIAGYATLIDNELVSEKDMPF